MRAAIAGVGALLVLVAAGPATAKEAVKAKVCGASDCREVRDREQLLALMEGGAPTDPPDQPAGWFRAEVTVRGDGENFTFPVAIVPEARLLRGENEDGTYNWMPVSGAALRAYREMTRGLEPLPAASLRGLDASELQRARVSEVFEVAPSEGAGNGSFPAWLVAGIGAIALLAAALALVLARRRGVRLRLWPPGSTRPT
jgi:hypothetical protein